MKLQHLLPHKRNSKFLLDGEVHSIDNDGRVDVTDEQAEELLGNKNWSKFDPDSAPPTRAEVRAAGGGIQLLDSSGAVVDTTGDADADDDTEEPTPEVEVEVDDTTKGDAPEAEDTTQEIEAESGNSDPAIPTEEGQEWADPKEEYSREWLEACATAYAVKFSARTKNKTLVAKITKAMY